MNWKPAASLENIRQRAELLATIRQFFAERDVMEVETPVLSNATVTDVHLASFDTQFVAAYGDAPSPLYLQTSPEFAMKRLLSAGSGAIYQLGKAFRNEESGRNHNPEFTMLEWYRPGFDQFALMAEIDALMQRVLNCPPAERLTYQQAFIKHTGVDPLIASMDELKQLTVTFELSADWVADETERDTLLQYFFGELVEPAIGRLQPCFIYHFPASQAALAQISPEDARVAERFELYFNGMELANGFHELTDAIEQQQRFEKDNQVRRERGLPEKPIDKQLIAALAAGLPACSGVALGVDRLLMLKTGARHIDEVLTFPVERA